MGALLTELGFRQVALAGAGIFIVALVALFSACLRHITARSR